MQWPCPVAMYQSGLPRPQLSRADELSFLVSEIRLSLRVQVGRGRDPSDRSRGTRPRYGVQFAFVGLSRLEFNTPRLMCRLTATAMCSRLVHSSTARGLPCKSSIRQVSKRFVHRMRRSLPVLTVGRRSEPSNLAHLCSAVAIAASDIPALCVLRACSGLSYTRP